MFGATLAENVVMDHLQEEELEEKMHKIKSSLINSGFEEKLNKLEDGLFTQVTTEFDKKGVDFSGGESQKVAISRAFYKDAEILIMDEPSSALDPIAEYQLFDNILKSCKENLLIFISHRLSSVKNADSVILLEKGQIKEEGTHKELMKQNGLYADMYNKQAKNYLADSSVQEQGIWS